MITKTARTATTAKEPCYFYSSAREGMTDLLRHVIGDSGRKVLLPAYIGWSPREGSGVFDPIRELGSTFDLYPVGPSLEVDVDSLRELLVAGGVAVVVLIHYFGRTEVRSAEIAEMTRQAGAILVEDLAHGFFSDRCGDLAGRNGDVSLYSLHKMFPLSDGGMLRYRNPELVSGQESTRPELAQVICDYDWNAIADLRRSNFVSLAEELSQRHGNGVGFELLWSRLDNGDVPQTLPVRILTGDRDRIYAMMNEDGFGMVSLYHTLIDEARGLFPAVDANSRSVINFPVHQDVDQNMIPAMVDSFEKALAATQ